MINKYALMKVVKTIIRENEEYSIRDVARKANVGPSTAKGALDFLLSQGILKKRNVGRSHLFKVKDGFLTRIMKILYSLSEINSSGFVEEVVSKNSSILSIILYGSVARGNDDKNSDIDMLIISKNKIRILDIRSEKKLKRELTVINYSYKEWKEKAEKDKAFYYDVILNCISLYGEKPIVM
ncbi:MAG: nucleotidyltransferase domain-containing protein [Candidatus Woesearchaeota archaeon]